MFSKVKNKVCHRWGPLLLNDVINLQKHCTHMQLRDVCTAVPHRMSASYQKQDSSAGHCGHCVNTEAPVASAFVNTSDCQYHANDMLRHTVQ
jgi:hypothetical protein